MHGPERHPTEGDGALVLEGVLRREREETRLRGVDPDRRAGGLLDLPMPQDMVHVAVGH
jgi:hypothetical protein